MPVSRDSNIPEELLRSLDATTLLIQNLIGDIKEHSSALILIKAKLESLNENVEILSHIVRDGNGSGSVITRLALAEKTLGDLEDSLNDLNNKVDDECKCIKQTIDNNKNFEMQERKLERKLNQDRVMGKVKVLAIIAPGIISLIVILLKLLVTGTIE